LEENARLDDGQVVDKCYPYQLIGDSQDLRAEIVRLVEQKKQI